MAHSGIIQSTELSINCRRWFHMRLCTTRIFSVRWPCGAMNTHHATAAWTPLLSADHSYFPAAIIFLFFFFFCLVVLFCECLRIIYNFPFCFYVVCVMHAVIYCCARKRTLNDVLVFRTHMHNECDTRLNCVEMSVYHLLYCMKILRTFITGLLRMHNRKCHVFWWNEIRFYWLRRFYSHLNASFAVIRIYRCGIIRNGHFPCNMIQILNQ